MTVAVGDILRVTAAMTVSGNDLQNVYHFKAAGTGTSTDEDVVDAVALELDTAYTYIEDALSSGVIFETIDVYNVTQMDIVGSVDWPTLTVGGGGIAESTAFQLAAVVRFLTATAKSQGRKFIGLLIKDNIGDAGRMDALLETVLGLFAATLLTGWLSDDLVFAPGNWNPTLVRFAYWTEAIVNEYLGTQRRRKGGIGS